MRKLICDEEITMAAKKGLVLAMGFADIPNVTNIVNEAEFTIRAV